MTSGNAHTQSSESAKIVELIRKDKSRAAVFSISQPKYLSRIDGKHIQKTKTVNGKSHEMSRSAEVRKTYSDNRDKSDPKAMPIPINSGIVTDLLRDKNSQNNTPENIWIASTEDTNSDSVGGTPAKNASAPMGSDEKAEARMSFFRSVHFMRSASSTDIPSRK
jgi:hypothetical protein